MRPPDSLPAVAHHLPYLLCLPVLEEAILVYLPYAFLSSPAEGVPVGGLGLFRSLPGANAACAYNTTARWRAGREDFPADISAFWFLPSSSRSLKLPARISAILPYT